MLNQRLIGDYPIFDNSGDILPLDLYHADTCLPSYFSGHFLPVIAVPVYPMTIVELRENLLSELNQDAINLGRYYDKIDDYQFWRNAEDAINRLQANKDGLLFADIEIAEDGDSVYAYFVFGLAESEQSNH